MKKRKVTALVMALVLGSVAFSGCGKKETESKYKIYYVNEEQGEEVTCGKFCTVRGDDADHAGRDDRKIE